MKPTHLLLWLLMTTFPAIGCMPEDLGGGLDIVNETRQPLIVVQHTIAPNGGRFRLETTSCGDGGLTARTEDGAVVAELTEEWCPGQTWTITGKGESTLEDQ